MTAPDMNTSGDTMSANPSATLPRSPYPFRSSQAQRVAGVLGIMLKEAGALDSSDEEIAAAVDICRALADLDPHGDGVATRRLFERLEPRHRRSVLERRLSALMTAGAVEKEKEVINEQDVRLTLSGSLSLILVPWLKTMSGQKALLEMFSRAQARASSSEASAEDIRADLAELRRVLSTFANEVRRAVDSRKTTSILELAGETDDRVLRTRISQLRDSVVARFADQLTDDLERFNEAGDRYVAQQLRLLKLLSRSRGVLGHWVQRDEVHEVMRTAGTHRLAALWDGIAFDESPIWIDPTQVLGAVRELTYEAIPDPIPEPAVADTPTDPLPSLQDTLRSIAERLLDGQPERDITEVLLTRPWPGPAVLLAQLSTLEGLDIGYELHHPGPLATRPCPPGTRLVSALVLRHRDLRPAATSNDTTR
ncbi:hypothetical protein HH310_19845 [Actinoplanes sp. TBRC 11911]|uniref:hypothetical protein n=1 Tax=Actinoplanes sp. TBRC 11911 TaxID=2729386 RepID=UPI00145DD4FC|nr:hypothetical protein [Actinoplanes sp. TBRC 11911]NMO53430.1 hypothetical protein [Actinoplanes sp. TBRC 11911]